MCEQADHKQIIEHTRELLKSNPEWRGRYSDYATRIIENEAFIKENRKRFREWSPLKLYLTTTNAKEAKRTVKFNLRYLGQIVAEMKCQNDRVTLSTNPAKYKNYEATNKENFGCEIILNECSWDGSEARAFRKHFKNRIAIRNKSGNRGNEESRIESLLLSEFSKQKDKELPNIKPVKIAGLRFPMPTPISASDHNDVKYSKHNGGGIDILARTGTGGRATTLCIIEVKDEYDEKEPASAAIKQALKYSVFIRELLRSDAGADWWKLFGFGGTIPKKLVLFAACAMPYEVDKADESFAEMEYDIDGDTIQLHFIYFKEAENTILQIHSSLSRKSNKE